MANQYRMAGAVVAFVALVGWAEAISAPARLPRAPLRELEKPIPKVSPDMTVNVKNIAGLLKEGNAAGAKRLAEAAAMRSIRDDDGIADMMDLFKLRNKRGLGWGSKPQPMPMLDGLERTVFNYARRIAPNDINKTAENEEAAYWIAALAELTAAAAPAFKGDGRTKIAQDWFDDAARQREGAVELARASAASDPNAMQMASQKITMACQSCHRKYRD